MNDGSTVAPIVYATRRYLSVDVVFSMRSTVAAVACANDTRVVAEVNELLSSISISTSSVGEEPDADVTCSMATWPLEEVLLAPRSCVAPLAVAVAVVTGRTRTP